MYKLYMGLVVICIDLFRRHIGLISSSYRTYFVVIYDLYRYDIVPILLSVRRSRPASPRPLR